MWCCPHLYRKLMVAGGRKRKKKGGGGWGEQKRRPYRRRWVQDGSLVNSAAVPALNLLRKLVRYKKQGKKKKKNMVLDFVKLEYYKEVLNFYNIE